MLVIWHIKGPIWGIWSIDPNGISLNQTVPERPPEWEVHKDRDSYLFLILKFSAPLYHRTEFSKI